VSNAGFEGLRERSVGESLQTATHRRHSMTTHLLSRKFGEWGSLEWAHWNTDPSAGDVDIDNDGSGLTASGVVDLSAALSMKMGRQMSQMAVYKINYIRLDQVNVDDTDDNSLGANFDGQFYYFSPSKHRIDALQAARLTEKAVEATQIDADSFLLSTDKDYVGLRFNYDATDNQVKHATHEDFGNIAGSQWSLNEIFRVADLAHGAPQESNALWAGRCGQPEAFGWATSYQNQAIDTDGINADIYQPNQNAFEMHFTDPIEVLGGLLKFNVFGSSTDSPQAVDDDYNFRITVGVTGWEAF